MRVLAPSILAANKNRLGEEIASVARGGAGMLHIDVMDGHFVASISYGSFIVKDLRKESDMFFDVHLMTKDPLRFAAQFAAAGADMITFHVEAAKKPVEVIAGIRALGTKVGISLNPGTPVEDVLPYLSLVDEVMVMSVVPGLGGQKFIPESLERIRVLADAAAKLGNPPAIGVDGGVNSSNLEAVMEAGATKIVAGTAVFGDDPEGNTRKFVERIKAFEEGRK